MKLATKHNGYYEILDVDKAREQVQELLKDFTLHYRLVRFSKERIACRVNLSHGRNRGWVQSDKDGNIDENKLVEKAKEISS